MVAKLRWLVWPPCGENVRRLMGLVLLGIALPRLPIWPGPAVIDPLTLLPQAAFGYLGTMIAIGLLATAGRWRLRVVGRGVAILAFVLFVTLAFASASHTSIFVELAMAYAALGEIVDQTHEH